MVYRRKRTIKKRTYNKRRTMNISRPRMARNAITCKRTFGALNWSPSNVTTTDFWKYFQFSLGAMPSGGEFIALFDQYKINGIKVTFRPRYDSFAGNDTTDTTLPGVTNQGGCTVHVINDKYSQVSPTGLYTSANLNSFLENGNVRSYQGNKPFSFYISRPAVDQTVGGGATASRKPCPWLQTSASGTALNGAHIYVQDVNNTGVFSQSFDVFFTYYMSFKNLK